MTNQAASTRVMQSHGKRQNTLNRSNPIFLWSFFFAPFVFGFSLNPFLPPAHYLFEICMAAFAWPHASSCCCCCCLSERLLAGICCSTGERIGRSVSKHLLQMVTILRFYQHNSKFHFYNLKLGPPAPRCENGPINLLCSNVGYLFEVVTKNLRFHQTFQLSHVMGSHQGTMAHHGDACLR